MSADEMSEAASLPDLRYLRELARLFKQYELGELEIEVGDQRISFRRSELGSLAATEQVIRSTQVLHPETTVATHSSAPTSAPAAAVTPAPSLEKTSEFITSPFVGTFYRSPRPDIPSFVEIGTTVQRGQTLCIVEAMKLFNEIEAEFPCVIEACLVENGQAVEYGAKLFRVRKL